MTAYAGNQAPPGGKHVVSAVPGGPRDLSAALARHRALPAGPTVPAGGWPSTAGSDPDAPAGITASTPVSASPMTSSYGGGNY